MKSFKRFFQKYTRAMLFSSIIVICCLLILCTGLLLKNYSGEMENQAATAAALTSADTSRLLSDSIREYKARAELAAALISQAQDNSQFMSVIATIRTMPAFEELQFMRYFYGENEYDTYGNLITHENEGVLAMHTRGEAATSGVVYDRGYGMNMVPFYAPVQGGGLADGVVLFFPLNVLKTFGAKVQPELLQKSEFMAFCAQDGTAYDVLYSNDSQVAGNPNVFQILRERINDKTVVDRINQLVQKGESGVIPVQIGMASYILTVGGAGENSGGFCVVGLYKSDVIYSSGYEFMNAILGMLGVFFLILIGVVIYFVISRQQIARRIAEIGANDPVLGCATQSKFESTAQGIFSRNRATHFAVMVADWKHYKYIQETYGKEEALRILRYLQLIISKTLQVEEIYGYLGEGQFVLLMHYRDRAQVIERVRSINELSGKYFKTLQMKSLFVVQLDFGIFETVGASAESVHEMVLHATEAKDNLSGNPISGHYRFYDDRIRKDYARNADIEVNMERALAAEEFQVYLQPKLNLSTDRPDSSEALVRWQDSITGTLRAPGEFMPVFEANGFVVKLDRYVFYKTCQFIFDCVKNGQPVLPVSVNVSRVCLLQADFLDYYRSVKKKFGIADKFITLEFTESFAYEDYDFLRKISADLHRAGFLCSMDDFGTGYSSYNSLKAVPVDEIKLDAFFIQNGISAERDSQILSSVIELSKKIGLKVVQEGVETKEELEHLRALGCHTVQGFYYSKPLPLPDFLAFLNSENERTRKVHHGIPRDIL